MATLSEQWRRVGQSMEGSHTLTRNGAFKRRYYGHRWDQKKRPYYRVSLLSELIIRKLYGVGPRKLSIITSVRNKRVSVKRSSTIPHQHTVDTPVYI